MVREELPSKLSFRPVVVSCDPQPCGESPPLLFNGPGRQVDHLSPSSVEVKNKWSYASASSLCLYGVDKDDLYLSTWTYPPKCLGGTTFHG